MRRISIDVGGTFTDCLVLSDDGSLEAFKSPTVPSRPSEGVLRCLELAAEFYEMDVEQFVADVEVIIHGTTLALNTLVTGRGANVGMLTTEGFRDVIEIRRGLRDQRVSLYDLFIPPYEPLVPRYLRLGVPERVLYTGEVLEPLDEVATRDAAEKLRAEGVDSVAVCFLHSYANTEHERRAAAICEEVFGAGRVTTSHEILPVWREFERFSTTVVSAYVAPVVVDYVTDLEAQLAERGLRGSLLMMLANGLVQTVDEVKDRAVYLLNSGPAAAPFAALDSAAESVGNDLISIDMGGTSFDVCVIRGGVVPSTTERWVEDHRVAIKMVDVHSIGAGGGSIASVDALGLLRVGPASAGADPGPACYGKGGADPTVTDANLVLGYIPPRSLAGGEIELDEEAGREVLRRLGLELQMSAEDAARAVYETVTATMADKIMEVCTRQGHDVRDFALVVGGGAGALHGASLAERLQIDRVFIPAAAGLYSAFGMLAMGIGRDFIRSYPVRADQVDSDRVRALFEEMEGEARASFERMGVPAAALTLTRTAEMRYVRQFHEIEVPVPAGDVTEELLAVVSESFHDVHEREYGFSMPVMDVEFLIFHVRASAAPSRVALREIGPGNARPSGAQTGTRACIWGREVTETPIFAADLLRAGDRVSGPAIIEAHATTIGVPPPFTAVVDRLGNYRLERNEGER
jgi:N-methylhydantoinase A